MPNQATCCDSARPSSSRCRALWGWCALGIMLGASGQAIAGEKLWTLARPDPFYFDKMGTAIHAVGDILMVSAPFDDSTVLDGGSVHLFDRVTGSYITRLVNPVPEQGDYFGQSLGHFGNSLVVGVAGATTDDTDTGAVMLFDRETFAWQKTMWVPGKSGSYLGHSVATTGPYIIAGGFKDDVGADKAGSTFVFNGNTGDLVWEVNNPFPDIEDFFGEAIAAQGDFLAVGAREDDTAGENTGSVYVYNLATQQLVHTLNNPEPGSSDFFGWSVAMGNGLLAVGAPEDDQLATNSGRVYLYDVGTGNLVRTLVPPKPIRWDLFGDSLAFLGDKLLIGSPAANRPGAAYLYDAQTGTLLDSYLSPTARFSDAFGDSIYPVGNDAVLIGATLFDPGVPAAGAGFLYQINLPTIAEDLNQDGAVDAADAGILFGSWGGTGAGDLTQDGIIDAADAGQLFAAWTGDSMVALPEPNLAPALIALLGLVIRSRKWSTGYQCDNQVP